MQSEHRHNPLMIAALLGVALLGALVFTLSTQTASAQGETAQRTPLFPRGTPETVQRTPQWTPPAVEWTPENYAATAEAFASEIAVDTTGFAATAEAFASEIAVDPPGFAATAEAYAVDLATIVAGYALTDEQRAALDELLSRYDLVVDQDAQRITVYTTFSEATINALVAASLDAYGQTESTITVDLVPGGAVLTVTGVEINGQLVTATVTVGLSAANGDLVVTVISVAVNGAAIPPQFVEPYIAAFEAALDAALAGDAYYEVQSVFVSDTDISLVLTFYYGDLPDFETMPALVVTPQP